jgi:hypothetical protein
VRSDRHFLCSAAVIGNDDSSFMTPSTIIIIALKYIFCVEVETDNYHDGENIKTASFL